MIELASYRYLRDAKGNIIPGSRYEVGSSAPTPTTSTGSGGGGGGGGSAAPSPSAEVVTSPPPLSLRQANPYRYNYLVRQYNAYIGNLNATARAEEQKKSYSTPLYDEASGTLLYQGLGYSVAPEKVNAMIQQLQTAPVAMQSIAPESILKKNIQKAGIDTSFFVKKSEPYTIKTETVAALDKYSAGQQLSGREAFLVANAQRIALQRQANQRVDLTIGRKTQRLSNLIPDLRIGTNTYNLPDYTGRQVNFAMQRLNTDVAALEKYTSIIIKKANAGILTEIEAQKYQEKADEINEKINNFNEDIADLNVNYATQNALRVFGDRELRRLDFLRNAFEKQKFFIKENKSKPVEGLKKAYSLASQASVYVTDRIGETGRVILQGTYGTTQFLVSRIPPSLREQIRKAILQTPEAFKYSEVGLPFYISKKVGELADKDPARYRMANEQIKNKFGVLGETYSRTAIVFVPGMAGIPLKIASIGASDDKVGVALAMVTGGAFGAIARGASRTSLFVKVFLGNSSLGKVWAISTSIAGKIIPAYFVIETAAGTNEILKTSETNMPLARQQMRNLAAQFSGFELGRPVGEAIADRLSRPINKIILYKLFERNLKATNPSLIKPGLEAFKNTFYKLSRNTGVSLKPYTSKDVKSISADPKARRIIDGVLRKYGKYFAVIGSSTLQAQTTLKKPVRGKAGDIDSNAKNPYWAKKITYEIYTSLLKAGYSTKQVRWFSSDFQGYPRYHVNFRQTGKGSWNELINMVSSYQPTYRRLPETSDLFDLPPEVAAWARDKYGVKMLNIRDQLRQKLWGYLTDNRVKDLPDFIKGSLAAEQMVLLKSKLAKAKTPSQKKALTQEIRKLDASLTKIIGKKTAYSAYSAYRALPNVPYSKSGTYQAYPSYSKYAPYKPYTPYKTYKPYTPYKAYAPYQKYTPYTAQYAKTVPYKQYSKYAPYKAYAPYQSYTPYKPYAATKPYTPYQPYKPAKAYTPYKPYTPYKTYKPYSPYVPPPITTGKVPPINVGWQKFSGEIRKRQATDVYTKKNRKFIKLNRQPLTPRGALIVGHQFIENDPSRTIILRKTKGYPKDIVGIFPYWQYRPPKGRSIYGKEAIIEKARYAINTPGEKAEISRKGRYFRKKYKY